MTQSILFCKKHTRKGSFASFRKHSSLPSTLSLLASTTIALLCLTVAAQAAPGWVKEAMSAAQEITPHKDASALVILNAGEAKISDNGHANTRYRRIYKVLLPSGVGYTTLRVGTYPGRKVKGLKGWVIRDNGKEKSLKEENVIELALDQTAGYYDEDRTLSAALRDVKPGDIVAWQYEVHEKNAWDGLHQSFIFQVSLPVVTSEYSVTIPEGWQVEALPTDTVLSNEVGECAVKFVTFGNTLTVQRTFTLNGPFWYADQYASVQELYQWRQDVASSIVMLIPNEQSHTLSLTDPPPARILPS